MIVYHKYYADQDLVRAFVMDTDKNGDKVKRFLGDGVHPSERRTNGCKCGGTTSETGAGLCCYRVCLKCGSVK